jgi:ABC-type glutathione transport system ATPase component
MTTITNLATMSDYAQITVDSVRKHFGGARSNRHFALDDVSVQFDTSSRVGIVGESGSGKSTLARMMVALETPTEGTVTLNGREVSSLLAQRSERKSFRRDVQFVAQDTTSSFDPRRKLRDAVRYPAQNLCGLDRAAADERVDETLELLGLNIEMADRYPDSVSGGQRQRFALARALVVRPRLLICDEVVSALDVSVQGSILNLLKRYCNENNAGIAFVSHGLPATAFIADELIVMYQGKIVEQGPTQEMITAPQHEYTQMLLKAYRGHRHEAA